jgi:hypothetical protein
LAVEVEPHKTRSRIWSDGDRLFVLADGLWVLDVSTPVQPEVIAYHASDAVELGVQDDTVVLVSADGDAEVVKVEAK